MIGAIAGDIIGSGYEEKFKEYFEHYPGRGYGPRFRRWATSRRNASNNSKGNGSAMRVNPVGFAFNNLDNVLEEAKRSAAERCLP
jgi:ADP-ribosylglycohydrolase